MKLQILFEKMWTKNYLTVFLVLWTLLVAVSVLWNFYRSHEETTERARIEARTIFQHNLAYRRWNTAHGGVYAEVTKENQPNPYLFLPRRDVITKEGTRLTLINPFQMTKQAYELLSKQSPLASINRTISLKPLDPLNTPDRWETKALGAFEEGKTEFSEITEINGLPYMRVLSPYMTEERCLKCHGHQGYKVGDIRGAMSIAVPMQPYYTAATTTAGITLITHLFLWLIGAGAIVLFSGGLRRYQAAIEESERKLLQAQKMEALGQVAGGIAHDFNNVLTAIGGFAYLLRDVPEYKDKDSTECVDQISLAVKFGKNLTSNLLTFGRKQLSNPVNVDLLQIINTISDMLKTLIPEDIALTISPAEDECPIFADPYQIGQMIINLCTNAKDAMPLGGELHIKTDLLLLSEKYTGTYATVTPGTYMMLSVRDTGTGMDEKIMDHIFEPFFSTKHSGKGTGLGLTIVHSIVHQHHGFIDIESELNKGTTFKIFFPASRVNNNEMPVSQPEQKTRTIGKGTLLVAEDDEAVRKFLRKLLVKRGYTVVLAEDGEEAIRKYHENKDSIDMLILDVVLPGRNGSEVYNFIKSDRPDIKALFISGYTDDIITADGILDENLKFLSKPIDAEELLAIVLAEMESLVNV